MVIKASTLNRETLPVTAAIARWDGKFTEAALQRLEEVVEHDHLTGDRGDGGGRIRPSSIGIKCQRAKLLSFKGHRGTNEKPMLNLMAKAGTWSHYKWQLDGLSSGALVDIEVPVTYKPWYMAGSIDGLLADGSGFELKTVTMTSYNDICKNGLGSQKVYKHLLQIHAYMRAIGTDEFSLVYENRNLGDWVEFRVKWMPQIDAILHERMAELVAHIEAGTLPPIQPGCLKQRGTEYAECPWKDVCFSAN